MQQICRARGAYLEAFLQKTGSLRAGQKELAAGEENGRASEVGDQICLLQGHSTGHWWRVGDLDGLRGMGDPSQDRENLQGAHTGDD